MPESLGPDGFGGVPFGHGFGGAVLTNSWVSFCRGTGCGEPVLSWRRDGNYRFLKKGICRAWIDNFPCEQISLEKFQRHSSLRSCSFVLKAQFILYISLRFWMVAHSGWFPGLCKHLVYFSSPLSNCLSEYYYSYFSPHSQRATLPTYKTFCVLKMAPEACL